MVKNTKPTSVEIELMQKFYDEGNSLRQVQIKFSWSRPSLIKYLKTRQPKNISNEERKNRAVNRVVTWRTRVKQKLVEYKGGKCEICGYNKCINCLSFHHLDPKEKDFQISGTTLSFERQKNEVDKCQLLCHNCHGEIHAAERF